jgi:tetratricopeptide (TPR) repeat protein
VIVPYGITVAQTLIPTDEKSNYAKQIKDLFDQSNWDAGKNILDEGIEKYPKESDLRMLAGKYYEHLKQHDKARYELNKALEYNPNNVSAKEILVNVETESGRYSSAICYINELLEITPYKPSLWQKKIQLYEFQGYTADANRLRKRISTIYPNDSIIQKDLRYHIELETEARRMDGKLDETISLSRELVQQQPGNAEYYLDLINDYLKAGDQNSAMIYTQRGLNKFPGNLSFIDKKTSFLAEQKRYSELLSFLQQEMKKGNSATLQQQYNYYLEEAAEEARNNDPATLYGRVLEHNPGNEEAFNYVFNSTMANLQYEEALNILNRYKKARGESKALTMKELMVYNRMGNTARVAALTKQLFGKYPEDSSLREAYVNIMLADAKSKMADNNYSEAIVSLNLVTQYGDEETQKDARHILYNAYMGMGDYNNALDILKSQGTNGPDILVKQADIYYKQQRYPMAVSAYEQAIDMVNGESKAKYIGGYSDMLTQIVKELNEQYLFDDAMKYIERWITYDTSNPLPLHYAVNLSYIRKKIDDVQLYAEKGYTSFPDDIFFKVKLAEIKVRNTQLYAETYNEVRESLIKKPYHKDLINAFAQLSEDYSKNLIKNKRSEEALSVTDTALYYSPANKSLKYMKGLALESIHRFDSAYYYQSFYDPSAMEIGEFRQHLNYLKYKSYRNEVGIYYMRNSFGDDNNAVSSVATIDYSRYTGTNTYVGRINYTGRDSGTGRVV